MPEVSDPAATQSGVNLATAGSNAENMGSTISSTAVTTCNGSDYADHPVIAINAILCTDISCPIREPHLRGIFEFKGPLTLNTHARRLFYPSIPPQWVAECGKRCLQGDATLADEDASPTLIDCTLSLSSKATASGESRLDNRQAFPVKKQTPSIGFLINHLDEAIHPTLPGKHFIVQAQDKLAYGMRRSWKCIPSANRTSAADQRPPRPRP